MGNRTLIYPSGGNTLIQTEVTKCAACPHEKFMVDDIGPWDYHKCGIAGGPDAIRDRGIIDPKCPLNSK